MMIAMETGMKKKRWHFGVQLEARWDRNQVESERPPEQLRWGSQRSRGGAVMFAVMDEEINSLKMHGIWKLASLPADHKPVGN